MAKIIEELITEIKSGNAIWTKPWTTALPRNYTTGRLYSGLNVWALMYSQMRNNYSHAIWAGYGQWSKAGYQVQKGEHGTEIITFIRRRKTTTAPLLIGASSSRPEFSISLKRISRLRRSKRLACRLRVQRRSLSG